MPSEGSIGNAEAAALRWRDDALSAVVRGLAVFWVVLFAWLSFLCLSEWASLRYVFGVGLASALWTVGVARRREASATLRVITLYAPLYLIGSVSLLSVGFVPGPVLAIALSVCVTAPFISWRWILVTLVAAFLPYGIGGGLAARGWTPGELDLGAYVGTSLAWNRSAVAMSVTFVLVAVVIGRLVGELEKAREQERASVDRALHEAKARELSIATRRRTERDLIASHRMDTLGKIALGISHDYNNQLMVILGWVGLLEGPLRGRNDEVTRGLAAIARAADEGRRVTAQLLAMSPSRLQSAEGSTNVRRALEGQLPMIRHLLPEDTKVELVPGAEVHALVAPGDFAQVALSFALDARSSMEAGDRLIIEARSMVDGADSDLDSGYVEIDFARDTLRREPPSPARADELPPEESELLTLASAVAIADHAGGSVRFDPDLGFGMRATVQLPAARRRRSPVPAATPPASLRGATILVAEDDEAIRRLIGLTLQKAGATVISAADGSEAIELARTSKVPVDLLCTDGIMPGVTAAECIAGVEAHHPGIPVIVVSGHIPEELEPRGARELEFTFVSKPVRAEKLVAVICRAIGERDDSRTKASVE